MRKTPTRRSATVIALACAAAVASAQAQPVAKAIRTFEQVEPESAATYHKVSLADAVARALARNVSAIVASAEVERAEALVTQARAGALPSLVLGGVIRRVDAARVVGDTVLLPETQRFASATANAPLLATRAWATMGEAGTNAAVAKSSQRDVARGVAVSVARAYLAVTALKRRAASLARAGANARSHHAQTHARLNAGAGSRVDELRAAEQVAISYGTLAATYSSLTRAREALSLLIAADWPVDTTEEIELPQAETEVAAATARRPDVQAAKQTVASAQRASANSWTDFMPTLTAEARLHYQDPPLATVPRSGWEALLIVNLPIFEGGLRVGQLRERDARLAAARAQYEAVVRQTHSDLRAAIAEARRADEAMRATTAAADLARQALDLANAAYRAGAISNLEVIDAERQARDAEAAVIMAGDNVCQARLALLVAAGQFP